MRGWEVVRVARRLLQAVGEEMSHVWYWWCWDWLKEELGVSSVSTWCRDDGLMSMRIRFAPRVCSLWAVARLGLEG